MGFPYTPIDVVEVTGTDAQEVLTYTSGEGEMLEGWRVIGDDTAEFHLKINGVIRAVDKSADAGPGQWVTGGYRIGRFPLSSADIVSIDVVRKIPGGNRDFRATVY